MENQKRHEHNTETGAILWLLEIIASFMVEDCCEDLV